MNQREREALAYLGETRYRIRDFRKIPGVLIDLKLVAPPELLEQATRTVDRMVPIWDRNYKNETMARRSRAYCKHMDALNDVLNEIHDAMVTPPVTRDGDQDAPMTLAGAVRRADEKLGESVTAPVTTPAAEPEREPCGHHHLVCADCGEPVTVAVTTRVCDCGCGLPIPSSRPEARYATGACRVRAHRVRVSQ